MEYTVTKVQAPDFQDIPVIRLQETGWLAPLGIQATAQLCHDGKNLYVRMEAVEKNIRAELKDPLDQVCQDSCLEFFFDPDSEDFRYFNFEFNPLGNFYIGFGKERGNRARQLPADVEQVRIHPYRTETGWGITYQIPGDFIRLYVPDFQFSKPAACNFYKCGECTLAPHYLTWAPLHCEDPDYHRRQDFGTLFFQGGNTGR